jgi:peroxiredoxin
MTLSKSPSPRSPFGKILAPFLLMFLGLAFIGAAIGILIFQPGSSSSVAPARMGQVMTNFTLKDTTGRQVSLQDYRGKVVLINVWATWCPPCQAEMPDLQAFYSANQQKGLVILAIDAGDELAEVKAFAQDYGLTFPILLDPQANLVKRMNIFDYPTSLVVDRQGTVRNIRIGKYTPDTLRADLAPFLTER